MRKISKKVLFVVLALILLFTLATPAFGAVNVDGNGGTSMNVSIDGPYVYSASNQMWKISIFYARRDYVNTSKDYKLWNTDYWVQYGKTFYMYHPTAQRGTMGKINLNGFKNAIFVKGNKVQFYGQTTDVSKVNVEVIFYNDNHFYSNTKSPAVAFNGYTIGPVKDYFEDPATLTELATQAYKAAGKTSFAAGFDSKTTFRIDGFSSIDKTGNSGKSVTTGYTWSSETGLTYNDWTKGVKTDYKGKQIYLQPKTNDDDILSGTAWMIVYEPVVRAEVNPFKLGGNTYCQVAATPTEWAILAENGIIELKNYRKHMLCYLGNSTYLEKSWNGMPARSSEFPTDVSNAKVYKEGGIGMTIFNPYNYVIKDYSTSITAPKSTKVGSEFELTFKSSNLSAEYIGNGGKRESPINVKFVWLASIKKGSTTYWFDLYDINKNQEKELSIANALKKSGSYVSSYDDAAAIVESRRSSTSNGLSPFNKSKHYYKGCTTNPSSYEGTFKFIATSDFAGCTITVIATTNVDSSGKASNAKKELNTGAYIKSGQKSGWGNNYATKSITVTSVPEEEPTISIQLNNKTSNDNLDLSGKRFVVWCIGGNKFSSTSGTLGEYKLIPAVNGANAGIVGFIETDEDGYGELNLADANVTSGQDVNGVDNTTTDRTATGISQGYFGSDFATTGCNWIPAEAVPYGTKSTLFDDYYKGNIVFFEHPDHGGVDTTKYTLNSDESVTIKSTGKVSTGFVESYQFRATKATGYSENSKPIRDLGYANTAVPLDYTLKKVYGTIFGGGQFTGTNGNTYYYNKNNKMTFVIRPIDKLDDETINYSYGGKKWDVYGYKTNAGEDRTTQGTYTFTKITAVYNSSLTGTTVTKPNTTNYFLNTEIANCPIKNGILTLDKTKVIYEDQLVFNMTPGKTDKSFKVDIIEDPGTVTVNYEKGNNCTISSFQGAQVRLTASDGTKKVGTLNSSGSVTFTNVPAGPFSVVPVVNGDTNEDGNLCACDGSITQLNKNIDVGCNIKAITNIT